MTDAAQPDRFHCAPDFVLGSGRALPARLAYVTLGRLNEQGSNAILVTHGYTASHRFVLDGEAATETSWSPLVGPGRAIDTDRFFVVSSNALGSSYGSTSPASIDPDRGGRYASRFPAIAFTDVVAMQRRLLDALGVRRLHAVVGVSMGGYQALQWGVQYPGDVDRLVVALSDFKSSPGSAAKMQESFEADPGWSAGDPQPGALAPLLARMRIDTLRRYGLAAWLADQGMAPVEFDAALARQADAWARDFDPRSMLVLRRAIEAFDLRDQLHRIQARMLLVLCTTDAVFPSTAGPAMLRQLAASGVEAGFHELDSRYGHLASGLDWQRWAPQLRAFLEP